MKESNLYVNPMMGQMELNNFIEIWKKSDIIKERNFNKKLFNYALVTKILYICFILYIFIIIGINLRRCQGKHRKFIKT